MSARIAMAFLAAGILPSNALAQDKRPLPDEGAIKAATELVQNVFRDDFAKANTRQKKAELAAVLLKQGRETKDDIAGRFVLLTEASRLAGDAADFPAAVAAIAA